MRYSKEKIKELTGVDISSEWGYIEVCEEKQYKSQQQSRLFHALLMCFWKSGCSSFDSYEAMRNHYKEVAHLIEYKFVNNLKESTKSMLWKAIKLLPIEDLERMKLIEVLRGRVIIWHSWSECSKEMAEVALNQIINDMTEAGVYSSGQGAKFEEIMKGLENVLS